MKLFVYGTLKTGAPLHHVVRGDLYFKGALPCLVNIGTSVNLVRGEILDVTKERLLDLDQYEGHPTHYKRVKTRTLGGAEVWIYEYQLDLEGAIHV